MKQSKFMLLQKTMIFVGIVLSLLFSPSTAFSQDEIPLELSLDFGTRVTEVYDWAISKTVWPVSADASAGETVTFSYEIVLGDVFSHNEYWLSGTVFVYNPMPTTRNFTISALFGESYSPSFVCFDVFGASTFSVRGESTTECSFSDRGLSGPEFDGQEGIVTVTTTDSSPGVTSTATWLVDWSGEPWVDKPWEIVTVVDDADEPFVDTSWQAAPYTGGLNSQNYTCPSDSSLYQNGQYTVSLNNTASVVLYGETLASDTATVTVNCFTEPVVRCTYGQGYWVRHGQNGPAPYDDAWLNIGPNGENTIFFRSGQTYMEVLSQPPRGDPYYILAGAYIATVLNSLNGVTMPQDVIFAKAFGDEIFYTYGPDDEVPSHIPDLMREFAATLNDFNNGVTGPGSC
jgi:hypothetical protein